MRNRKENLVKLLVICCFLLFLVPAQTARAASGIMPTAVDNLRNRLKSTSALVATDDGYMRVFYDEKKIGIEYYDNEFQIQRKKTVAMELSLWGGFYAGFDAYYLVEGQNNTAQSDTAEVIRVIRYDKNWNRTGAASITANSGSIGAQVCYPFDYGCVEMTERDGILYIVTGHQGYVDEEVGQGHQGFLMIAVDEASMTGEIVGCDLWHSFAQYITCKDSDLYVLQKSEGSRCTELSKYGVVNQGYDSVEVFKYGGTSETVWAISCYASVNGVAVSSDHVLCIGTSIDQSKYDSVTSDMAHNIYLTVTPLEDFSEEATTVKWLTNFSGGGKSFQGLKITRVNDNCFMISWEEYEAEQEADTDDTLSASILHYLFIDGKGNQVSEEFTAAAPVSDCQPIVKDGKIVYYASNDNMVNFYFIDAETGELGKKGYRVAGENATWDLENGVLTISGTGPMYVDTEEKHRMPLSSTAGSYGHSSGDNAWKPIMSKVEKIVIKTGITSIPERGFAYFSNFTEVEIEPGLQSIGKEAFYSCSDLEKITIPASVTSIGEDFLWTGYYWVGDRGHVVDAEIYAPEGSYAAKYAEENGIRCNGEYNARTTSILNANVSGIKKTYAYKGKAWEPKVTVKLDGKTLKKGTDYRVSYENNIKAGEATLKIKGVRKYKGTITKTFKIVPAKVAKLKARALKAKTIRVSWKKDKQADGYQIQYAGNAKFTKGKKSVPVAKRSAASKKIAKLARGKRYFVRIRAYKNINGEKCYGAWCKAVKVKSK